MKTRPRKYSAATIPASRWLAYATAGAATALAGATAADAEIHYSGRVDTVFRPDEEKTVVFPLDQDGNFFTFEHYLSFRGRGAAYFGIKGLVDEGVRAFDDLEYYLLERVDRGQYVSRGDFVNVDEGTLFANRRGQWTKKSVDFVGFRFDNGAGLQYGWVRVQMYGRLENYAFAVLDYAYADPGESIKAGQTSSLPAKALDQGSLGLLAIGAAGLTLWRQRRKRR